MEVEVITKSKGLESYYHHLKSHCRVAEGMSRKEHPQLAALRNTGLSRGGVRGGLLSGLCTSSARDLLVRCQFQIPF